MTAVNNHLYFIGTEGGLNSILKKGILPPEKVFELIDSGQISDNALGCSAYGRSCSFTPEYVSLESHPDEHNLYMPFNLYLRNRVPVVFKIKDSIRQSTNFVTEDEAKKFRLLWPTELGLFKGIIPQSLIEYYATVKNNLRDEPNEWESIDAYIIHKIK